MTDGTADEVLAAAEGLVRAFGSHDRDAYFSAFAPDATFLFHTLGRVLGSRAEYEQEWAMWEADGFHVEGCRSIDRRVDLLTPDVAVFTHRVRTSLAGSTAEERERETIVFRKQDDGWRAVHEHLSADPGEDT